MKHPGSTAVPSRDGLWPRGTFQDLRGGEPVPRPHFTVEDVARRFVCKRLHQALAWVRDVDLTGLTEFVGASMNEEKYVQTKQAVDQLALTAEERLKDVCGFSVPDPLWSCRNNQHGLDPDERSCTEASGTSAGAGALPSAPQGRTWLYHHRQAWAARVARPGQAQVKGICPLA